MPLIEMSFRRGDNKRPLLILHLKDMPPGSLVILVAQINDMLHMLDNCGIKMTPMNRSDEVTLTFYRRFLFRQYKINFLCGKLFKKKDCLAFMHTELSSNCREHLACVYPLLASF